MTLVLDFTTNATLFTKEMVEFLSAYDCHFQITLDGNETSHNNVKKTNNTKLNCYRRTLQSLKLISEGIPKHVIAVRINFDLETLGQIDEIIKDISFLDRKKSYVIVKKIWQVITEEVNKERLLEVIQKIFDNKFLPDYYVMPKGDVCFAERTNQVLFNFDGGVFKCSTICTFDKDHSLGTFDPKQGRIEWDEEKTFEWSKDEPQEKCKECAWFAACLGPCNRQLIAHQGKPICTFDAMNLTQEEYLMYLFKYNQLLKELHTKW